MTYEQRGQILDKLNKYEGNFISKKAAKIAHEALYRNSYFNTTQIYNLLLYNCAEDVLALVCRPHALVRYHTEEIARDLGVVFVPTEILFGITGRIREIVEEVAKEVLGK